MKIFGLALCFGVLALGCSTRSDSTGPAHVTIQTGEPPALIAFREESSTQWQPLIASGTGTFDVVASGPFHLVIVCDPGGGDPFVQEYVRTPADPPMIEHDCQSYPFLVNGSVTQPGAVSLGNYTAFPAGAPWTFSLPAAAGSFDLVMLPGDPAFRFNGIATRRGVAINGDTQLGTLDLNQEFVRPLIDATFSPQNFEPGERTFSDTTLYAGQTIASIDSTPAVAQPSWSARLAPDGALQPGDHQVVSLSAILTLPQGAVSQTRYRSISHEFRAGEPRSATLPELVHGAHFSVTADRLAATWDSLPEHDELAVERDSFSPDGEHIMIHVAVLSADYVAAVHATNAALDFTSVPGFRTEWRHDPDWPQALGLFANTGTSVYESTSSGVTQFISSAPPRAQSAVSLARSRSGRPVDRRALSRARPVKLYRVAFDAAAAPGSN